MNIIKVWVSGCNLANEMASKVDIGGILVLLFMWLPILEEAWSGDCRRNFSGYCPCDCPYCKRHEVVTANYLRGQVECVGVKEFWDK